MKILIWDTGCSTHHALRFAEDGNEIKYFTAWSKASPEFMDYSVGLGFPKVKKIKQFMSEIDWADLIIFTYNTAGDLCDYLRETTGKPVFGAGLGEKLELDRAYLKKIQKEIGLPVQPHKIINGIDAVIDYIEKSPDKFVKLSTYRGDLESFHAKKAKRARIILNKFRTKVGPFEKKFQFIVEDKIDFEVETGFDLFFNGEDYLRPYLWGYLFDNVYVGRWSEELPKPLEYLSNKLKPVLKGFNYRGAISSECMITKQGKVYLIDLTCRLPMPLSILWDKGIENLTEVFLAVAKGENVEIEPSSEYVGIIDIKASPNEKDWLPVDVPDGKEDKVKVFSPARVENELYSTPQSDVSVVVLGYGDSIEDVVDDLRDVSDVEIYDTDIGIVNEEKLYEIIKKGEGVGLEF